jgi:hypothetical protein
MNATLLYRIASVLFLLFAIGHTLGFLTLKPPTPEALAVRDGMRSVHFQVGSGTYSYGGFYNGFGLYVTAYLLFSAFLAWQLSGLAVRFPQAIGGIGWIFFTVQLAGFALSWVYFSAAPATLSALVAMCLGAATWMVQGANA